MAIGAADQELERGALSKREKEIRSSIFTKSIWVDSMYKNKITRVNNVAGIHMPVPVLWPYTLAVSCMHSANLLHLFQIKVAQAEGPQY